MADYEVRVTADVVPGLDAQPPRNYCLHDLIVGPEGEQIVVHTWYIGNDNPIHRRDIPHEMGVTSQRSYVHVLDPTDEQRREQEQMYAKHLRQRYANNRQWVDACENAKNLLKSVTSEEQWDMYTHKGKLVVKGKSGNRYQLAEGGVGGHAVTWLNDDDTTRGIMCIHPAYTSFNLPSANVIASQLLALDAEEVAFIRRARCRWGQKPSFDGDKEYYAAVEVQNGYLAYGQIAGVNGLRIAVNGGIVEVAAPLLPERIG